MMLVFLLFFSDYPVNPKVFGPFSKKIISTAHIDPQNATVFIDSDLEKTFSFAKAFKKTTDSAQADVLFCVSTSEVKLKEGAILISLGERMDADLFVDKGLNGRPKLFVRIDAFKKNKNLINLKSFAELI